MNDAAGAADRLGERGDDLKRPAPAALVAPRSAPGCRLRRTHREERPIVDLADLVDLHDMRMQVSDRLGPLDAKPGQVLRRACVSGGSSRGNQAFLG